MLTRVAESSRQEQLCKISKSLRFTYVTEHRYVAGFGDCGLDEAGAFRSEEGHDPVTDHVDHCFGSFDGLSSRVAPSHHQLHVRQNIRIVVDLKRIYDGHSGQFYVKMRALESATRKQGNF